MLSAIYIKGFKTFAKPVRMPLEGGATVIVGPNGSGKSNITDAVLFALGEQSPGVLRAGAMGDVIFSGSETLKAAAAAEITLVLDNSSGEISLPYEEVSITRRVSRGGDTEYRVNGARSRLADVRAVAGEAGMGRHSILRQGAVDAIVTGGASACRTALEEAAGLGVYRRRRLAASRRLERADAQLEKSRQLEAELADQLRRIEGEAEAARQYRDLEARHRKLSLAHLYRLATWETKELERKARERASRAENLASREKSLREESARIERQLRETGEDLGARERTLESLEDSVEHVRSESLRSERALMRLRSEQGRSEERGRVSARLREELRRAEQAGSDLESKSEIQEKEHSSKKQELDGLQQRASAAQREQQDASRRQSRLTGNLERLQARRERETDADEEPDALDLEELERVRGEVGAQEAALHDGPNECLEGLIHRVKGHSDAARDLGDGVRRREGVISAARGDAEARMRSLDRAEEKPSAGVRLHEVIRPRPGYERAVESALGEAGEGILAGSLEEGIQILSGTERVAVRLDAHDLEEDARVSGRPLLECVEILDENYAGAVRRILAGIHVVDELNGSAPENGHVVVTKSGLRLSRTSVSLNAGDRFERQARLRDAKERLELLGGQTGQKLRGARESISEAARRAEALGEQAGEARSLLRRAGRASKLVLREVESHEARTKRACEERRRRREQRRELEREISEVERDLGSARTEAARARERLREASSAAERAREETSRAEQKKRGLQGELSSVRRRREKISGVLARRGEVSETEAERVFALAGRASQLARKVTDSGLEHRSRLRKLRSEVSEKHREMTAEQSRLAARSSEVAGELATARAEAERAREDLERARQSAEAAEEEIREEWSASLEVAREESERASGNVEAERDKVARGIRRFGDVNLLALSQEQQLRERHEFVSAQRTDAEDASAEIGSIIRDVDREIESRFDETFERVQGAFREMVPRMMEGSSGELELSEEGVEIGLRLGRRGRRPLRVLSGGERSLLALSFLFAIFLSHRQGSQRTFCIVDEAEAALDDVNLARFLAVVDSYKADGQLILVTHQKRTMAAADVLYGVTQDASGTTVIVSKRLSGE